MDAEHILKISLACIPHEDEMAWSGESSCVFSVRSAYKLLKSSLSTPSLINLQTTRKEFYKKIIEFEHSSKN